MTSQTFWKNSPTAIVNVTTASLHLWSCFERFMSSQQMEIHRKSVLYGHLSLVAILVMCTYLHLLHIIMMLCCKAGMAR